MELIAIGIQLVILGLTFLSLSIGRVELIPAPPERPPIVSDEVCEEP